MLAKVPIWLTTRNVDSLTPEVLTSCVLVVRLVVSLLVVLSLSVCPDTIWLAL